MYLHIHSLVICMDIVVDIVSPPRAAENILQYCISELLQIIVFRSRFQECYTFLVQRLIAKIQDRMQKYM